MSDLDHPYRGSSFRCPACASATLREFDGRLVCDTCSGIHVTEPDLVKAIEQLSGIAAELEFFDTEPGKRSCPRCEQAMTTCRIRIAFPVLDKHPKASPTLDRCATDGIWFDAAELAKVFETVIHTAAPRGGGTGARMDGHAVRHPGNGMGWGFGK